MALIDSAHLGFSHNVQALLMIYLFSALAGLVVVRYSRLPWLFLPSSWRFIFWCGLASQFAGCWALGNAYAILQSGIQIPFAELPRFSSLLAWGWRARPWGPRPSGPWSRRASGCSGSVRRPSDKM